MANTNLYAIKSTSELKDYDMGKREVAIYLSKFDTIDSDTDMIKKGAFRKSIKEHGPKSNSNRKIAFLRYHDWTKPIGKFLSLEEDDYGLYAVGKLGTSTLGEDAMKDYDEGIIREHSIGFQYIPDKIKYVEDKDTGISYNMIKEVKLWEGSAVTFGANDQTYVADVMKSEDKNKIIDDLSNELGTIIKSMSNGQGTDERLYQLEMRAKYLSSQLSILAKSEPLTQDTQINEPLNEKQEIEPFNWNQVIEKINHNF